MQLSKTYILSSNVDAKDVLYSVVDTYFSSAHMLIENGASVSNVLWGFTIDNYIIYLFVLFWFEIFDLSFGS